MILICSCNASANSSEKDSGVSDALADTGETAQGDAGQTATQNEGGFNVPKKLAMPDTKGVKEGIEVSHVNQGYVCAAFSAKARLKFQVGKGDAVYNYDMPNDGSVCVFPVNMGDGEYLFRIMLNTEGSNYVEQESATAEVQLDSEFAPFLLPNIFCDYDEDSACVAKARDLASGAANEAEAVERVCMYVIDTIAYDESKAAELSQGTGYIPNPDDTLADKSGICFDYASLGAAMLRSLGIPTKIVTGYVSPGDLYHAWIMVYADGQWKTAEFSVNQGEWSRVDLTFASTGATQFSGDGTDYTDRYIY